MLDSLGDRMKENYESVSKQTLIRRMPAVIRLDGRAFHTFANGVKKPFDDELADAIRRTSEELMQEVQNCKLAYSQSDEISLLLIDYNELGTDAWFSNDVQKMVSVSASIATGYFNSIYKHKKGSIAVFDARAFNLPKEEVSNYFLWRQQDCLRNSVSQTARSVFSHKQLHGKTVIEMKKMLSDAGSPWEKIDEGYRNGWLVERIADGCQLFGPAPLFKEHRECIHKEVYVGHQVISVDSIEESIKQGNESTKE